MRSGQSSDREDRPSPSYAFPRAAMRPGRYRVGAWTRSRHPLSVGIRALTRGRYHHVGLITPDNEVIEATMPRVRAGVYLSPHDDQVEMFVLRDGFEDGALWLRVEEFMRARVGSDYDTRNVLRFVSKLRPRRNDRWFCSELLAAGFAHAGLPLVARVDAAKVSPSDLVRSALLESYDPRYL